MKIGSFNAAEIHFLSVMTLNRQPLLNIISCPSMMLKLTLWKNIIWNGIVK